MFFGGTEPTWSNRTLREVLQTFGQRAKRIAWMDLHTGLGPSGLGERIFAGNDDAKALARARAWWDGGGATPVTSFYDGSSTSAKLTGLMCTPCTTNARRPNTPAWPWSTARCPSSR
jgi:hypothetical protein